ncbi:MULTISPECIES: hypothetical protein [unclassified Streptomyces]|nr:MULTISPECIES: hypothetical protein [unclassified Streptomyces]MCX4885778.1 hypothetical protein [Streptomyces sp. NBC_00847]MCX5425653.1 hypothetical protein [Streptomyces sp. NBC_00078]
MPQDVTFDLAFDTPVSRHPEYVQECFLISPVEAAMHMRAL